MDSFSFYPPKNLAGEGKQEIAVTSFEATIFVFNKALENITSSIRSPEQWSSRVSAEMIHKF